MVNEIKQSKLISELLTTTRNQSSMLVILSLYTDNDFAAWNTYQQTYPKQWINAYDKAQAINTLQLYDLKAMPTLYLLDKDKKVLLKDIPFDRLEKYLSEMR